MAKDKKKPDGRANPGPGRHPAQRPIKLIDYEPREPPAVVPQDVKDALKIVEEISKTIEDEVPEWKVLKNQNYFASLEDRAKGIGETIERTNRVTDAQVTALENMLSGLQKWVD